MGLNIHVHIYDHRSEGNGLLDEIKKILELLINQNSKLNTIMANQQEFEQALTRLEAATTKAGEAVTAIGARITSLEDAIKNAGLPADVEAALLAKVTDIASNAETLATSLESMGKSPTDPVPDPVPDPIPGDGGGDGGTAQPTARTR